MLVPGGNRVLVGPNSCGPHFRAGEVATEGLGVAGNRVEEVRMLSVAAHPANAAE
jgi:hypothetical protein